MIKTGRVMYNWPVNSGGVSPCLNSIKTETNKLNKFVHYLLGHHENNLSLQLTRYLVANMLRFLPQFEKILKHDPTGKYTVETREELYCTHPFLLEVSRTSYFNIVSI